MSENLPADFCPYKGLQPYTEQDCAFFFGRTRDEQIIISNLYAAQLTVFYGASGVGKSSVLLAGSVPLLKQEPNLTVVVFRNWQDPNFTSQLKQQTLEAVSSRTGKQIDADLSLPLDEFLGQVVRGSRGPLFFVFDQFEEYFLYNPPSPNSESFAAEFARAVNRRDLNVNFLLSLREDGLSKLDRFQGRIPTLMNNMLRLEHLDRDGAKEAITKPLDEYNRRLPSGQEAVTIEPTLIESVLDDLRGVKVTSEQTGQGTVENLSSTARGAEIETPLLQMVLTRLWDEERAAGSQVLRLQTFEALGRAENIARTHLDTIMGRLTDSERNGAANILRYMVTPSGAKIAQEAGALASWTELTEAQAQTILVRLSGQDMRILRTVQAPGELPRYEIFHDVLAQAILNWRRRYVAVQQEEKIRREEQERREEEQEEAEQRREKERSRLMRRVVMGLSAVLVVIVGLLVLAVWQARKARIASAEISRKNDELEVDKGLREGVDLAKKRRYEDAIRKYDEVIRRDPSNLEAYSYMGYAYINQKDYPNAIKTLEELTSKHPSYIWGHFNLSLAYWRGNKKERAIQEVKEVLKLDPTFCATFTGDSNYRKLTDSPEFIALCPGNRSADAQ